MYFEWFFLVRILVLGLVVCAVCFLVIRYMLFPLLKKDPPTPRESLLKTEEMKILLPLRLQACERFVLFLERIHPNSLLLRVNYSGLSAKELQAHLLRTIREEFEYNLSQQLYISAHTWELVRHAKEGMISLVNRAATSLPADSSAATLTQAILDLVMEKDHFPVDQALESVKKEISGLL